MAARHRGAVAGAAETPDLGHGEAGVLELLGHLLADLETVRADARADDRPQILRVRPEDLLHHVDNPLRNLQHRPFPARVHGGDDAADGVVQEDRHTVGRPDPDGHPGEIGNERIIPFQLLPRHPRTVDDRHPGPMDLMPLNHRVGQHGVPPGGEGLDAGAEVEI